MENLNICRICLRTDLKTYRLDQCQLLAYYEEVMAQKILLSGSSPHLVCYACAWRLQRAHRFKESCHAARDALKDLLCRGTLTKEALNKIDRDERNLLTPLNILSISQRVKYYCTRHDTDDGETATNNLDKTDLKHIDPHTESAANDMLDTDLELNKIVKSNEEGIIQETTAIESKSVLIVDIKDESTLDMTEDAGALEMSEMEIVPVIEFIDIKKEGVKEEELILKQTKQKQPQRCKSVKSKDEGTKEISSNKAPGKRKKAKVSVEWSRKNRKPDDSPAFITNQSSEPKRRKKLKKLKRKPTTCYQCGATFSTQLQCMRHHVTSHPRTSFYSPADRHICEICGASLAPSSVSAHQNMHSREKLHSCETCGRAFHAAVGLRRHLVTHTGERRYACGECGKRFTQSNSMKLHHRTAHLHQPYPKRNRRRAPAAATERDNTTPGDCALEREGTSGGAVERDKLLTSGAVERDSMPASDSPHYLTLP